MAAGAADRGGFKRIVRPGVLGVAAAEFFPYFEIRVLPETVQILRQLDRLEAGGEQFHQDGAPAVVHAWRVREAEALLQADAQDGEFRPLAVLHAYAAAGGDDDMRRREPLDGLLLAVIQQ